MAVRVTVRNGDVVDHEADYFYPNDNHHLVLTKDDGDTTKDVAVYAAGYWIKAVSTPPVTAGA